MAVPLSGGSLGLRLVLPSLFANATNAASINLGLLNALVNNPGNILTFPRMSFVCMASSAGSPVAGAPFENRRFEASVSLDGAVTTWGRQQVVNRLVTNWKPDVIGTILVCSVVQLDSLQAPFYRKPDLSLGVISIDSTRFVSQSPSFGLSFLRDSFSVTVGTCTPTSCTLSPSAATSLFSSVALLVCLLVLVQMIM